MKLKKAQGLPLNIIIIAIILLIVMAVVIFIFLGGARDFDKGLKNCEAKGGVCKPQCASDEIALPSICPEGELCCIPVN